MRSAIAGAFRAARNDFGGLGRHAANKSTQRHALHVFLGRIGIPTSDPVF